MVKGGAATVAAVHEGSGARSDLKLRGVRKRKWGKWVAEIRLPNSRRRIWLGSYDSHEKAGRAFDAAVFCLRGPGAKFNFPDSPPVIPGGGSLTHREIQAAAARFANSGAAPPAPRPEPAGPASSPSLSASEASSVLTTDDGHLSLDLWFLDLLECPDPVPGKPDFGGVFPGLEEFPGDFNGTQFPSAAREEVYLDEVLAQDSFLWSFLD